MATTRSGRTITVLTLALLLGTTAAPAQPGAAIEMLIINEYTHEDMRALMARDKFAADPETGYPGMPNGGIARKLNRAMNGSLEILLSVAAETRSRSAVLERVRGFLVTGRSLDLPAAENERILWCYGRACEILGVEIEDEQLETWFYGPQSGRG